MSSTTLVVVGATVVVEPAKTDVGGVLPDDPPASETARRYPPATATARTIGSDLRIAFEHMRLVRDRDVQYERIIFKPLEHSDDLK